MMSEECVLVTAPVLVVEDEAPIRELLQNSARSADDQARALLYFRLLFTSAGRRDQGSRRGVPEPGMRASFNRGG